MRAAKAGLHINSSRYFIGFATSLDDDKQPMMMMMVMSIAFYYPVPLLASPPAPARPRPLAILFVQRKYLSIYTVA